MPQFIFWCAFEHLEFRLPEFEAIAELFNINLTWIHNKIYEAEHGNDIWQDTSGVH